MPEYNRTPMSGRPAGLSATAVEELISNIALNDLTNVTINEAKITDGNVLMYNADENLWESGVIPANNKITAEYVPGGDYIQLTDVTGLGVTDALPSTSLNRLGTVFAYSDPSPTTTGTVKVYKLVLKTWQQVGQTLVGNAIGSAFGSSIQLNSNGDILVVGSTFDSNEGRVYVYQLIGDSWTQIGGTVLGFQETNCNFGSSVSINDTGNIIACGAKFALSGTDFTGGVKLYLLYSGVWTQIGPDLLGENTLDEFGVVALNASGATLVVGAPKNGAYGSVTAYTVDETSHIQIGSKVLGSARIDSNNGSGDLFGSFVAISDNGLIFLSHSSEKNIIYEFTTDWAIKGSQLGTTFTAGVSNAGLTGDGLGIVVTIGSSSPESTLIKGDYILDWTPAFVKDFDGIGDGIVRSLAISKDGNCFTAINSGGNATLYTFKRIISQADLTFFEPNGIDILARIRAIQSTDNPLASEVRIQVKNASGVLTDGLTILPS